MSEGDKDGPKGNDERRNTLLKAGMAVGVGSAAIAAALLYASKTKKPKTK